MSANLTSNDDLAAAKTRLIQIAGQFDLFEPIRKHPFLTIAIAGAGGALVGSDADAMATAASLTRSVAGLLRTAVVIADRIAAKSSRQSGSLGGSAK